ncbi:hypothetical protein Fmac_014704 [Flemingia macrophylla]|uniref:Uncharacterized protein n=1 Tax=Flemingia macrophylla TaxID=520843 RepID=A0ABD1MCG7_9FABA
MHTCANSRMRLCVLLLVLLTVMAATRPSLVDSRPFPSPTHTDKTTHEPLKVLRFLTSLVMTEKANISNRVLTENQVHTMSSGPSRRGAGH